MWVPHEKGVWFHSSPGFVNHSTVYIGSDGPSLKGCPMIVGGLAPSPSPATIPPNFWSRDGGATVEPQIPRADWDVYRA